MYVCGLDVPFDVMDHIRKIRAAADPTIAQAAAELQVDTKTIRRRITDGTLPAYRIKGSERLIRIRRADLEALKVPIYGGDAA